MKTIEVSNPIFSGTSYSRRILITGFWQVALSYEELVYGRSSGQGFDQRPIRTGQFLDKLRVLVRGGAGGSGLPKFGGVGGKGGSVIIQAKEGATLKEIARKYEKKKISASVGGPSQRGRILGNKGDDHVIPVPPGITVYNDDGSVIGEVNEEDDTVIVAEGGLGGCPETGFCGIRGQIRNISLELKLIADVGFVGFPNAGKSTLLKAVSNAKPKIASYPFTTMMPNIGVITYSDGRQISLADLPGLIEGAHVNIGLGHRFLRHVERTKVLLLVVDVNGFRLSGKYQPRSCLETVALLNKELELYREDLLEKPAMLVVNKMDTEGAEGKLKEIYDDLRDLSSALHKVSEELRPDKCLKFDTILPISAKTSRKDAETVKDTIRKFLDLYAEENVEDVGTKKIQELKGKLTERGPLLT